MAVVKLEDAGLTHRKQIIKARWEDGASLAQIGRELSVSRNSVLGHVRRMKLPQRTQDAIRQQGRANAAKQKSKPRGFVLPYQAGQGVSLDKSKAAPSQTDTLAISEPLRLDGKLVTLETLHHSRMCKYPLGDPGTDNFHYCANAPKAGSPYCIGHYARCYTPQTGVSKVDPKMVRESGIARSLG